MLGNNNCCGLNLDLKKITFLGIFTFSFPFLLFGSLLYGFLSIASFLLESLRPVNTNLGLLLKINHRLINSTLNLQIRQRLSARIFYHCPGLSGFIFRYFNILFLFSLWTLLVMILRAVLMKG